jgi:effector-binding domain-containing protein
VTDDFYKRVDGLTPAYQALAKWIEENNYQISGPACELFYGSPESGEMTAEIQFPVQKV